MRESRVERHLVREVKKAGGEVRKLVTPGRRHAPDRLVLWPASAPHKDDDRIHFIELKAPGKKARAGQVREHQRLRALGAHVEVLDTIEKVDNYVSRYK